MKRIQFALMDGRPPRPVRCATSRGVQLSPIEYTHAVALRSVRRLMRSASAKSGCTLVFLVTWTQSRLMLRLAPNGLRGDHPTLSPKRLQANDGHQIHGIRV